MTGSTNNSSTLSSQDILNANRDDQWELNIKPQLINTIKDLVNNQKIDQVERYAQIRKLVYDQLLLFTQKKISAKQALSLLKNDLYKIVEIDSILGDVYWYLTMEFQLENKESNLPLVSLINESITKSLVSKEFLKERLDADVLEACGFIKSSKKFYNKILRVNTRDLYTQMKYNIFKEETEGFSKVISELNKGDRLNEMTLDSTINNIRSLIGYFNLDPNRVLDIVLDAFELNIENATCFNSIISLFKPSAIPQLLGFKYQFFQSSENPDTPKSLHTLTATLLKSKTIQLEQIYPHLNPSDEDLKTNHQVKKEELIAIARKIGTISLVDKEEEVAPPKKTDDKSKKDDKEKEKEKSDKEKVEKVEKEKEKEVPKLPDNQKFGLLVALLDCGELECSQQLLYHLSVVDPPSNPNIAQALSKRISNLINPFYKNLSFSILKTTMKQGIFDIEGFSKQSEIIYSFINYINVYLYTDCILLHKICRIFKELIQSPKYLEEFQVDVENILSNIILPALSLSSPNPALAFEMWDMLKQLPYSSRYKLYAEWRATYAKYVPNITIKAEVLNDTKKVLRRLSKENVKQLGKTIGRYSHNNPIVVLESLLISVESYDNLVQPLVEALKYLSPLSFDVLSYILLERFTTNRSKLKPDGTNISSWFQGLSSFTGYLYRKYPTTELEGLLQYMVNQLKDNNSLDLIVLKELLSKMGGIEIIEELPDNQMEAQAGGETLRTESSTMAVSRNKKAVNKLKETLFNSKLAFPLLILISKQRLNIVYNNEQSGNVRMMSDLYDKCQETLLQYIEFLTTFGGNNEYLGLCNGDFSQLCTTYYLEPESAFHYYRPILQQLPPSLTSSDGSIPTSTSIITDPNLYRQFVAQCKLIHPPEVWKSISVELYALFWSLSLYDIYIPKASYENEISKLKQLNSELDHAIANEKEVAEKNKKRKDRERNIGAIDKLTKELEAQTANHAKVMERFNAEKDKFIDASNRKDLMKFIQYCIYPRAIFTPADATYCAKFVQLLHTTNTPNFSSLLYFYQITSIITFTITSCTENEAVRFGRYMCETLQLLNRWRSSESIFEKECKPFKSFSTSYSEPSKGSQTFEDFYKATSMWHQHICQSFVTCLQSNDYMVIRNSLLALTKLVNVFPIHVQSYQSIESLVAKIRVEREELKTLATRYHSFLEKNKSKITEEFKSKKSNSNSNSNNNTLSTTTNNTSSSSTSSSSSSNGKEKEKEKDKLVNSKDTIKNSTTKDSNNSSSSSSSSNKEKATNKKDNSSISLPNSTVSSPAPIVDDKKSTPPIKSKAPKEPKDVDRMDIDTKPKELVRSSSNLSEKNSSSSSSSLSTSKELEKERVDKEREKERQERDRERERVDKEREKREREDRDRDRGEREREQQRDRDRDRDRVGEKNKEREKERDMEIDRDREHVLRERDRELRERETRERETRERELARDRGEREMRDIREREIREREIRDIREREIREREIREMRERDMDHNHHMNRDRGDREREREQQREREQRGEREQQREREQRGNDRDRGEREREQRERERGNDRDREIREREEQVAKEKQLIRERELARESAQRERERESNGGNSSRKEKSPPMIDDDKSKKKRKDDVDERRNNNNNESQDKEKLAQLRDKVLISHKEKEKEKEPLPIIDQDKSKKDQPPIDQDKSSQDDSKKKKLNRNRQSPVFNSPPPQQQQPSNNSHKSSPPNSQQIQPQQQRGGGNDRDREREIREVEATRELRQQKDRDARERDRNRR